VRLGWGALFILFQKGLKEMKKALIRTISCMMVVIIVLTSAPLGGFVGLALPQWLNLFTTSANAIDSRVENAVQKAIAIANDNSHGYSQINRRGPDYDCSSLVYYAFSSAGFSLSPAWFNTNTMQNALINAGFAELTNINLSNSSSLQRGDILWKQGHTEIYIGSNQLVGAHSDRGYPQTGDQPGNEISVGNYYYRGYNGTVWTKVYRFSGSGVGNDITTPVTNTNKNYYHVGETAEIKWTASSANTDFYQYWLVIRNKTLNKLMFEGASGSNGNVYANSYNYRIPQKGEYTVTVYAVPYNDKGSRQKEYTKTFYVDTESKTIADDEYHIVSALGTDMTLDVSGTSKENEANVQIWHNLWNPNQTFNIKHLSNGCYTIIFKYSGKALDVGGGSTAIGANVQQYTYGGAPQQQWIIKPTSDGKWYNIISVHTGYYLTVANGSSANGANVEMRPNNGSNAQKWIFDSVNKHVHSYNKRITKNSTCTNSGIVTYSCSCGNSHTESTPALGHNYNSYYTIDTPATCTKTGSKSYHCSRCSATTGMKNIPKSGHTYGVWTITKQATSTENGIKIRQCQNCGELQTELIAKTTTSITKCTIKLSLSSAAYTGKALKPTVTVKNGKTTLKAGTHYTVTYKNNTKIGKATVTITGIAKNGYSGTKTLTFNIIPANVKNLKATQTTTSVTLSWSKVAGAKGYRVYKYDTKAKKWVKVADTTKTTYTIKKLKAGTSYKYAVKAYAAVSKTTYWSASYAQLSTATKPATPTLKATAGKKQAALSWNKVSGASGYVVYMATGKNGSFKKVATIKKGSTVKYTKKSLKKGTTYKFKIMTYKTVDGKNIYSGYSAVKTVKAK